MGMVWSYCSVAVSFVIGGSIGLAVGILLLVTQCTGALLLGIGLSIYRALACVIWGVTLCLGTAVDWMANGLSGGDGRMLRKRNENYNLRAGEFRVYDN
ncbi:hypothetical protein GYMLUDRAFT_48451 [Collybiopsis luxurians FD-317 M1]|uniref:Uncharacterized protein n=1 Tax=Collybiopsis luxurians FD-317 M1 TaxID=944289 RepID=A0A0D0BY35_9AGAR|nr:hypothetical protein GYMLUDRAFT_48451 [Collybiopsis luxurians FD-317 M1]